MNQRVKYQSSYNIETKVPYFFFREHLPIKASKVIAETVFEDRVYLASSEQFVRETGTMSVEQYNQIIKEHNENSNTNKSKSSNA